MGILPMAAPIFSVLAALREQLLKGRCCVVLTASGGDQGHHAALGDDLGLLLALNGLRVEGAPLYLAVNTGLEDCRHLLSVSSLLQLHQGKLKGHRGDGSGLHHRLLGAVVTQTGVE